MADFSLEKDILEDKIKGLSDREIGNKYNVNLKFIEKSITKNLGINISNPVNTLSNPLKIIKKIVPKDFSLEQNTVWSFKSRGSWATHNGNYRGNWSPYIPRNILLKYSNEDDLVLDYFCGSGTTGVEAKLLNRNFIGIDINENAVKLANENADFLTKAADENVKFLEHSRVSIDFMVGDARNLDLINDNSIDLICSHPPYSNIINYTHNNKSDLSNYEVGDFLKEIEKVAKESYRVLKDNKYCSILIGDMRKNKNVIPLGFWTIDKYLKEGFVIKELIIKRQHNCKTTGFWYTNSIKFNFLLLAHEYLVIFKKSDKKKVKNHKSNNTEVSFSQYEKSKIKFIENNNIQQESTTVWIFEKKDWVNNTLNNLIKRYGNGSYSIYNDNPKKSSNLLIYFYDNNFCNFSKNFYNYLEKDGILAIICEDIRIDDNLIYSNPIYIEKYFKEDDKLKIKEIVVIQIKDMCNPNNKDFNLNINHKYLIIYKLNG